MLAGCLGAAAAAAPTALADDIVLYATATLPTNGWINETYAEGNPGNDNCNSGTEQYSYCDSGGDWLRALDFDPFSLPAGQKIDRVRVEAACRYDAGTVANIDASVNIGAGWTPLPDSQTWRSDSTFCSWRLTTAGDITAWANWNANPDLVNQIQVGIQRQSGIPGIRLRVKAFRIIVTTSPCPANFNGTGGVTIQDLFDFLASYFAGDGRADINRNGGITVQDVFDFLNAYFSGC